jgi:ribosomal protein L21
MNSKLILSLLLTIFATSCSVNYHVRKAIKKGYRCDEVADTITINTIDSIPYVLRDSIAWEKVIVQKDTIVRYKRSFVPKTRLETRIEYKLKRDTLKMIEKVEVIKYKTRKQENKKPNLWLFIIGFGAGFVTKWLLKFSKYTL